MKRPLIEKNRRSGGKLRFIYLFQLALFCFGPHSLASADEIFHDPTRPPTILFAPQDRETIDVGPVLQSVSFSSGRRTAMISGQPVKIGSKVGDARVVSINETEVVLKTGNGLQTLKLFPGMEKHSLIQIRRHKP